ncbi:hypothetical protein TNCT_418831 [Trichonephila clavata]|uniref:Uncharacterized protein n=1 Tax=Trichonephila clavata TaxID=2740835 RepID=A0A8X6L844_TRICU|nr:hypothetical protein TNCT_418831 [Trichonephila clavata]
MTTRGFDFQINFQHDDALANFSMDVSNCLDAFWGYYGLGVVDKSYGSQSRSAVVSLLTHINETPKNSAEETHILTIIMVDEGS